MSKSHAHRAGAPFRRRHRRPPLWMTVLVAVVLLIAYRLVPPSGEPVSTSPGDAAPLADGEVLAAGAYRVERVVDGDTLLLENGARVRLLGVDTPETVKENHPVEPWGPEASEFTKDFLNSRIVRLEFDRERLDRFGRYLAYVYVDRKMLNEELIRAGLSPAKLHYAFSDRMKRRFRLAQDEARDAERGIWSDR